MKCLWGINHLDEDTVLMALPFMDEDFQARVEAAGSKEEKVAIMATRKAEVLEHLGLADNGFMETIANYMGDNATRYSSEEEAVCAAEGRNPSAFYNWIKSNYNVQGALENVYGFLGQGTTRLMHAIMSARKGVPLSMHIMDIKPGEVPMDDSDVDYNFLTAFDDLTDCDDIEEAYVRTSLSTEFDSEAVRQECEKYRTRGLLQMFPVMVWHLMGRSVHPVEEEIFAESLSYV